MLRDELFDGFFDFELAIARWLDWLGEMDNNAPFGQRLRKLADHPQLRSKAGPKQTKQIKALPVECSEPLKIRNLVAHSRICSGQRDGSDCIFFETVSLALCGQGAVIPIEQAAVKNAADEFRSLAKKLEGWLKQVQK